MWKTQDVKSIEWILMLLVTHQVALTSQKWLGVEISNGIFQNRQVWYAHLIYASLPPLCIAQ